MDLKRLGEKVVALRWDKLGYSQRVLADKSGVAYSTIQKIEKGAGNPTIKSLIALAATLGEPLIELYEPTKKRKIIDMTVEDMELLVARESKSDVAINIEIERLKKENAALKAKIKCKFPDMTS